MFNLVEVTRHSQLRDFISFPDRLYRDCPQYVPRLRSEAERELTEAAALKYCKRRMWMVSDGSEVVGRICALINPRYNERHGVRKLRFGWFDCINDIEVARMLFGAVIAWGKSEGMTQVHGPFHYSSTFRDQGLVVEGYEHVPPFNCRFNFPYYNDLLLELGFEKENDWVQNEMVANHGVPQKARRMASICKQKYGITIGSFDKLRQDPERVREFFNVYNTCVSEGAYGFVPVAEEEMKELADYMLPYLSDRTCCVLQDPQGAIVAFCITLPSMSRALKAAHGSRFLFNLFYKRRALRNCQVMDLLLEGALPEWRDKGISAIYYREMGDRAIAYGSRRAISSPQSERSSVANVWKDYEHEPYMRRRSYIKDI